MIETDPNEVNLRVDDLNKARYVEETVWPEEFISLERFTTPKAKKE